MDSSDVLSYVQYLEKPSSKSVHRWNFRSTFPSVLRNKFHLLSASMHAGNTCHPNIFRLWKQAIWIKLLILFKKREKEREKKKQASVKLTDISSELSALSKNVYPLIPQWKHTKWNRVQLYKSSTQTYEKHVWIKWVFTVLSKENFNVFKMGDYRMTESRIDRDWNGHVEVK